MRITIAVGDKSYFPPLSGPRLNIARWLLYQTHRCSHSQTCQIPEWYQIHIQKKCIQYNILRNGWTRDYHVWSLPYTSVFVNDSGANLQMKLLGMYAILVNHWHVIYTMFRIIMRKCQIQVVISIGSVLRKEKLCLTMLCVKQYYQSSLCFASLLNNTLTSCFIRFLAKVRFHCLCWINNRVQHNTSWILTVNPCCTLNDIVL